MAGSQIAVIRLQRTAGALQTPVGPVPADARTPRPGLPSCRLYESTDAATPRTPTAGPRCRTRGAHTAAPATTIVTSRDARNCARHPGGDQRLPRPERPDAVGAAGCVSDPQDGVSPGLRADRPHHVRQPGDGLAVAAGHRKLHRPKPESRIRFRPVWPSRWLACCCFPLPRLTA